MPSEGSRMAGEGGSVAAGVHPVLEGLWSQDGPPDLCIKEVREQKFTPSHIVFVDPPTQQGATSFS